MYDLKGPAGAILSRAGGSMQQPRRFGVASVARHADHGGSLQKSACSHRFHPNAAIGRPAYGFFPGRPIKNAY
jgi:hypothetical protein